MKRRQFIGIAAAFLASSVFAQQPDSLETYMVELINRERAKEGLNPLMSDDERLHRAARLHSLEMVRLNYLDHTSPYPENKTKLERAKNQGLTDILFAENVGGGGSGDYDRAIVESAMYGVERTILIKGASVGLGSKGFMRSEGHRLNILNPELNYVGVGIARDDLGIIPRIKVTQLFLMRQIDARAGVPQESQGMYNVPVNITNLSGQSIIIRMTDSKGNLNKENEVEQEEFRAVLSLYKNTGRYLVELGTRRRSENKITESITNNFYIDTDLPLEKIVQYR